VLYTTKYVVVATVDLGYIENALVLRHEPLRKRSKRLVQRYEQADGQKDRLMMAIARSALCAPCDKNCGASFGLFLVRFASLTTLKL